MRYPSALAMETNPGAGGFVCHCHAQRFTETPISQMLHHSNTSSWPIKNNTHPFSSLFDHELFPWKENLVVLCCLVCLGSLPSPHSIWAPLIPLLLLRQTVFWRRHVIITTNVTSALWQNLSLSLNNSESKTHLHGWMQYFFLLEAFYQQTHFQFSNRTTCNCGKLKQPKSRYTKISIAIGPI